MSEKFTSVDVERCRRLGHRFRVAGSDKTPLKRHLICETCSIETGKSAFAAYGNETGSRGEWQAGIRKREEVTNDSGDSAI